MANSVPSPVTRIFIDAQGNLVVTDLWEEIAQVVGRPEEESTE